MTPTDTNLLGLAKHLAGVELGHLGDCVGRPASRHGHPGSTRTPTTSPDTAIGKFAPITRLDDLAEHTV